MATYAPTYTYKPTWENRLLSLAYEAHHAAVSPVSRSTSNEKVLEQAYDYCTSLTAVHSRSFYTATSLLPAGKRRAIRALYAFCRVSDDIIDNCDGRAEEALAAWRETALSPHPPAQELVAVAWADARLRYHVPLRYAEQLLEGVARDLQQRRYETFAELAAYAYGVASTVGLMSMHIIGFAGTQAIPYAIKLGVALQMTNILRDVGEDWEMGRIYLPAAELALFGLSEDDLAAGQVDDRWRAFMAFQIARNRQLYEEAWPGIGMLDKDGRFAVTAAGELYRAILDDIEAHDYDVFTRRAHTSTRRKLLSLPGIWWRSR